MNCQTKGRIIVVRDRTNCVVKVIFADQGHKIPFTYENGRVLRDDLSAFPRPVIPAPEYQKMCRQVAAIFSENKTQAKAIELFWLIRDLNRCGVYLRGGGRLIITRWDKPAGREPKLIKQIVQDIGSAIRMQGHILDGYSLARGEQPGELDQLDSIETVIAQANQLLQDWRQLESGEKENLQRRLARVVLQLENCRNEFKVAARGQAEQVVPLKDSLGRPNPNAFAARTIAALGDLTQRIHELNIIMPYIAMRKQLLILADRWLKSKLAQAAGAVSLIARHGVFNGGRIASHEPRIVKSKIDQAICLLNNAVISPYFEPAKKARARLKLTKAMFERKNYPACKTELNSAIQCLSVGP